MTEPYRDEQYNPLWERTLLIEAMKECFEKHIIDAAIVTNDQNDILACLQGRVEPLTRGSTTYYDNVSLFMVGRWAIDGECRALLHFGETMGNTPSVYTLEEKVIALGSLTTAATAIDPNNRRKLSRSVFNPEASKRFAYDLFGGSLKRSNWHTLLGVTYQTRFSADEPKMYPKIEE